MKKFTIDTAENITLSEIDEIIQGNFQLSLSENCRSQIKKCRAYLDLKMDSNTIPIYGINTGFGSLCNVKIEGNQLANLQLNLVRSHACGTGNEVPQRIVKIMLLLKIRSLSYGHSGISLETIDRLLFYFNENILPVVYEQGSLGASGDLAPLAHLSLPLIGEGEVNYKGKRLPSNKLNEIFKIQPITLKSKEGLALLNGTQFMSAYGVSCCLDALQLFGQCNLIAAMSLDAFDGRSEPFLPQLHAVRPHSGQCLTAATILNLLEGSMLSKKAKQQVQDPYSFRCIPQVHGASFDAIRYCCGVFETEINSVSDNPLIFPENDTILSGGNFHGQPLALALDFLCISLAELASIAERRIYLLISGQRGLPPFLTKNSGLNSGFMITQYSAASIVSQNKQLATPASVDSIVSSNGQEDHVSMGANAAVKCLQVAENLRKVLSIELLNAAQALDFRRPATSSPKIEKFHSEFRKIVSHLEDDRLIHSDIQSSIEFLRAYQTKL
jgi:histidine ammonia-lyase